jgi:hypothetical protein
MIPSILVLAIKCQKEQVFVNQDVNCYVYYENKVDLTDITVDMGYNSITQSIKKSSKHKSINLIK